MTSSAPSGRRAIWPRRTTTRRARWSSRGRPRPLARGMEEAKRLGAKRVVLLRCERRVPLAAHGGGGARPRGRARPRRVLPRPVSGLGERLGCAGARAGGRARVAPIAAPHAGALGADDARADRSGIRRFVEVGNGRVLRGLARSVDKELALFGSQDPTRRRPRRRPSRPRRDDGALRDTRRGRHRRRQGDRARRHERLAKEGAKVVLTGRDGAAPSRRRARSGRGGEAHPRGGRRRRGRGRAGRRGDDRDVRPGRHPRQQRGGDAGRAPLRMSDEDWDVVLETNLKGAFR